MQNVTPTECCFTSVRNWHIVIQFFIIINVPYDRIIPTHSPSQSSTSCIDFFSLPWRCDPTRVMAASFLRFLNHTQRRTTVGRTPPDEWSARRRDLYLTTHNTHNRQTSMPPVEFEPTISAGKRPQTYALDRAATGTGFENFSRG